MKKNRIDIAVLGFGGRAEALVRNALENFDVFQFTAVVDPDVERLTAFQELTGTSPKTYTSAADFYNSNVQPDGVWVLSKENTHADLAVPALERRIPLIVEKPLSTTIEDAFRIVHAHQRNPVPLSIPHTLRYQNCYRKAREIVASGRLGKIMHVHAVETIDDYHMVAYYRRGPGTYRSETRILLAKCSHDLDIMNWIIGARAMKVSCFGGQDYFKPGKDVPEKCSENCPELYSCPFGAKIGDSWREEMPDSQLAAIDGDTMARINRKRCAWNSEGDQVDHQTLILEYADGATADFTLRCFGEQARVLHVTGSHGSMLCTFGGLKHEAHIRETVYHPFQETLYGPDKLKSEAPGGHGGGDYLMLKDWGEAVMEKRMPRNSATVRESAEAVLVCEGADLAMREGRVVDLNAIRVSMEKAIGEL